MTGVLSVSEARTDPVLPGVESANQPCAGALLRQAREASGLHIAALAVLLKVPVKKLEALESDRLDLLPDIALGHCGNMIGLARIGYYNGVIFHRVISGFMIQGGCPLGTGTGGPGYTIKAEFNEMPHVAGVLSMARTSDPHSAGSQFFICLGTQKSLDRQYTAFGKTADAGSLDVVKKIGALPTNHSDKPNQSAVIETATVIVTPA